MSAADRQSRHALAALFTTAAVTLSGCASRPSKAERFTGSEQHSRGKVVCTGLVTLRVNNTYGVPVDLIAHSNGRETFVAMLPAGRSEYTIQNPDQGFEIRKAGSRVQLERGDYLPSGLPTMRRVFIDRSCGDA